jgi:hypothetical protein
MARDTERAKERGLLRPSKAADSRNNGAPFPYSNTQSDLRKALISCHFIIEILGLLGRYSRRNVFTRE